MMKFLASTIAKDPTVHDLSEAIPATSFLYVLIAVLGATVIWFVVRDRNTIADNLKELASEFRKFREELLMTYALKDDLTTLTRKLDRYIEMQTKRAMEVKNKDQENCYPE